MSTDGSLAPLASSCGWFHAGAPAWRTAAKAEPPATNTTARRPPSDAATTGCAGAASTPPATRSGACPAPPTPAAPPPRAADRAEDEGVVDPAVAAHVGDRAGAVAGDVEVADGADVG